MAVQALTNPSIASGISRVSFCCATFEGCSMTQKPLAEQVLVKWACAVIVHSRADCQARMLQHRSAEKMSAVIDADNGCNWHIAGCAA